MRKILSVLKGLLLFIVAFILTMISYLLLSYIQRIVLVPDDFLLWTFNFPVIILIIIVELFVITILFYFFHKSFREYFQANFSNNDFVRKHQKLVIGSFIGGSIFLLYTTVTSITVVTPDKVIDHSFLRPLGREYTYDDVVKIDTEVKSEKSIIPLYSEGDFIYIIELSSGKRVYLNDVGETNDYEHPFFTIEEIDRKLVNRGIPKASSMENFELATKDLDKVYTDGIRRILENTDSVE